MVNRTALAVAGFLGSFAISANVHPPPCNDCPVLPVPVVVVATVEVMIDAGMPVLPYGVMRPSSLPKAVGDK